MSELSILKNLKFNTLLYRCAATFALALATLAIIKFSVADGGWINFFILATIVGLPLALIKLLTKNKS